MALVELFEGMGFKLDAVPSGEGALAYLSDKKPDLVIADDTTPGFDAPGFLTQCSELFPATRVIIITPEPHVDHALNLMKLGAMEYLVKPVDHQQLELCVKKALMGPARVEADKADAPKARSKVTIITRNAGMKNLMSLVERVADSSASVLIQGESGTGKELIARFIHEKSRRNGEPFVAVNCAALPENLLESELFGHEKGAFTGAMARKIGKFELANKGTLFLDEITEMQFHLQAKLLRVLQEKVVDRVGGTQPIPVDVRVIATTNRNAGEAVEKNDFREDLFYRLNTIPVVLPPLRERMDDLTELCDYFIGKYCDIDGRNVKGLTSAALDRLSRHPFSGNVRELENIIHRAVLLAMGDRIEPQDLMLGDAPMGAAPVTEVHANSGLDDGPSSLKEMEQKMIYKTLDRTEGNRTHAAKILGISVRTLRNKLNEYNSSP
ncbi:MAG: sigma-54 dependent transcriptional regulator [Desulfobacterales bacterium]|nr:sigma-54 dependent transcriptional regulator [Desulfobacterales bacterium]